VKAQGGATEMEFLGDGDEVSEMTQFDVGGRNLVHIHCILIQRNKILDV
jgi:hypothetical protein